MACGNRPRQAATRCKTLQRATTGSDKQQHAAASYDRFSWPYLNNPQTASAEGASDRGLRQNTPRQAATRCNGRQQAATNSNMRQLAMTGLVRLTRFPFTYQTGLEWRQEADTPTSGGVGGFCATYFSISFSILNFVLLRTTICHCD